MLWVQGIVESLVSPKLAVSNDTTIIDHNFLWSCMCCALHMIARILEDMVAKKVGKDDYRDHLYAVDYLQMLLVVCHSFPSKANLARRPFFA